MSVVNQTQSNMLEEPSIVAEQFEDAAQQAEASRLGLWTFLATEVLFFGVLFLAYLIYRHAYPADFAEACRHTNLVLGTVNSIILVTSSLTMALAVQSNVGRERKQVVVLLIITILLGICFLGVKAVEYGKDISDQLVPGANFSPALPSHSRLFFFLYWTMTGLHGVHLIIGLAVLSGMTVLANRGKLATDGRQTWLELSGLYWHFVDVVWIFLYPLLYLFGRHL
jgi:cytochrome c oxidase subunit 3